jgi:hypothetical protein
LPETQLLFPKSIDLVVKIMTAELWPRQKSSWFQPGPTRVG